MKHLALLLVMFFSSFTCSQTDGPASLPQRTVETRISFTPSSNPPKYVGPTDSLAAAFASAVPGDRIIVDPKNVTNVGATLALPNGVCPNQWVTVESSDLAFLPDEFTQIGVTYSSHMPKIVMAGQAASLVGGNCVRLIGFEITRPPGSGVVYNLYKNVGNDIILDRVWMHGTATDETNRGISLYNSVDVAVINSYFSDFHCMAIVGACGDSQAIAFGSDTNPQSGNYVIRNDYLEAAGENILGGGGPATVVTCDVTIQSNWLNKPLSWNPLDPSYAPSVGKDGLPHPWIVKNHFELKNGCRVLFEGNTLTNVWGGFTQVGASILLTAKNQAGSVQGQNQCPICAVTDVTVRLNHISNVGQALQISFGANAWGAYAAAEGNISIHDNVFDHGQYSTCSSCGSFYVELYEGPLAPAFPNVSIVNNTFLVDGWITGNMTGAGLTPLPTSGSNAFSFLLTGTANPTTASNWHLDNNIFDAGRYGVFSTGGGPTNNCWIGSTKIVAGITNCWGPNSSMVGNQITQQSFFAPSYTPWPANNFVNTPTVAAGANQALVNAAIANRH